MKTKNKQGQQLTTTERTLLISKLVEELSNGYHNSYVLAKKLNVSYDTVQRYRPLADELIAKSTPDRNIIRALQIKRTYQLIERLMGELEHCESIKEKSLIYSQIAKFSQHLALITGLNIETQVNIDHQQLVIIRADNGKRPKVIDSPPAP